MKSKNVVRTLFRMGLIALVALVVVSSLGQAADLPGVAGVALASVFFAVPNRPGISYRHFMPALELISASVTAPDATPVAASSATYGDSQQIRNFVSPARAFIVGMWGKHQTAGLIRVRSPKLHDNVNGITVFDVANNPAPLFPIGAPQPVDAQDTLVYELSGSATAGDIEIMSTLIWYENLGSITGRFIDKKALNLRTKNILTLRQSIVTGTAGGYSGAQALSAAVSGDLLKANVDYAVLGFTCSANVASIGIRGVDTASLRCGMPGNSIFTEYQSRWFVHLSEQFGAGMIPVINAANKGGTFVDVAKDENALTFTVITHLAELAS